MKLRHILFHQKTPAPEKPKWSGKQIESVIKIQNAYRLFKQRKMEEKERKKKETMDRLIEEVNRNHNVSSPISPQPLE